MGEVTWEPLNTADKKGVYHDNSVTVAIYTRDNKLLRTKGWKLPGLDKMTKTQERIICLAN